MTPALLTTKLYQPSPPAKRVLREHLIHRLDEGLDAGRHLTLVSAPAGFGKTTCVSEWLAELDLAKTWLSLDRSDDDPARFFQYFVAALQRVKPELGQEIESSLATGQLPPVETLTALLVNDIQKVEGKFILVLDDFQVIQDRSILAVLERLIANQPEQLHLILVTREDPMLPLARLRANNQMTELRTGDLRFTGEEAAQFLNEVMQLTLSKEDVSRLESRTEGWAAGLQLAGLSIQGRKDPSEFIKNLSGSHRYILSYLVEEVLSSQPEDIQSFLLQTSILDKLNGDLCAFVTGRPESSSLLERLLNANLFLIPLDDDGRWYRYHHLFADLLRNQQSRLGPDELASLHRRASSWYAQAGMAGEAIEHALAGADYPTANMLIERSAMPMTMQGYVRTVEAWIEALPADFRSQSPKANLAFAWMQLLRGNYAQVTPLIQSAEAAIEGLEQAGDQYRALRAELFALRSNLLHVQGKAHEGREMAEQALKLARPDEPYLHSLAYTGLGGSYRQEGDYSAASEAYLKAIQASRNTGNLVSEMLAVTSLALMAIQHGQLHFASQVAHEAVDRFDRSGTLPPPISGTVFGALALIDYEWNQLSRAKEYISRTDRLSAIGGHTAGLVFSHVILARLVMAEGQLAEAEKTLKEAVELLPQGVPAWLKPEVISTQVRLALLQSQPAAAEAVLLPYRVLLSDPERSISQPVELLHLADLQIQLFKQDALQEGLRRADELIASAEKGGRVGILIPALLAKARHNSILENREAALEDLEAALALAEPEGYVRAFVDAGPEIAALLQSGLGRSARAGFIRLLLEAFPSVSPPLSRAWEEPARGTGAGSPDGLIEPLTDREGQVLSLMASGLKYEEISQRLVISLNTVRFHVKAIYSKLQVNNRTKAIETARRLGLL